jgi:glycosyltransferase involved in cell wall biosynthesis
VVIDGMEVGGSQRQVQHLLMGLDRRRWEPELAFFRCDSFLADAIRRDGVPVHHLPKRRRIDLPFLLAYARLLRDRDYAIVHAFSLTAEWSTVLARLLSRRRPALVASERSFALDRPAWFWWLKRLIVGQSAAVIANSKAGAHATARRTGTPEAMFVTIVNGVAVPVAISRDECAATRRALGVPDGRPFGLFVGRLVSAKNLPCLVRALAMMRPGERPWIALAGGGPLRAAIEALAAEHRVEADLCFIGERSDATRLMQAADFLVLPSHFEGLSNALLESMAAGCPVIASAVDGNVELIDDGRTGLLFLPDDADALAAAMSRMADPLLRSRLAQAATQHVIQHHSQHALGAATSAVYERCLPPGDSTDDGVPARVARGQAK